MRSLISKRDRFFFTENHENYEKPDFKGGQVFSENHENYEKLDLKGGHIFFF